MLSFLHYTELLLIPVYETFISRTGTRKQSIEGSGLKAGPSESNLVRVIMLKTTKDG